MGDLTAAPIARSDVTLQDAGREAILHDGRSAMAHVINASAARVWRLLDGRPLDDVVAAFAAQHDRTPDQVRTDVERVVARFRDLDLLDGPAGA